VTRIAYTRRDMLVYLRLIR